MDQTLVQRSLRADDAPAVTEILAAMERAEPVDEAYSEQDAVEEITSPGVDLERGTLAVLDGDRLVASVRCTSARPLRPGRPTCGAECCPSTPVAASGVRWWTTWSAWRRPC